MGLARWPISHLDVPRATTTPLGQTDLISPSPGSLRGPPRPSGPSPRKRPPGVPRGEGGRDAGQEKPQRNHRPKAVTEVGINSDSLKGSESSGSERQRNHPTRLSSTSEGLRGDATSTEGVGGGDQKPARSHDTTCKTTPVQEAAAGREACGGDGMRGSGPTERGEGPSPETQQQMVI